ncbi:uncharacterized protein LOC134202421 [Armigeres subalbatus]|uniref:uncharacterized protein LOC134202421 n=1 Tax=Armigeres subalbatus TaxID=124917 RepID=UPI002ED22DC0
MDQSYGSEEFINEERLEDDPLEGSSGIYPGHASGINVVDSLSATEVEPEQINAANQDINSLIEGGAPESYVFCFGGIFCRKLFRSQLRTGQICSKDIFGDSVNHVLRCIWKTVKHQVNRKVEFNDEVPSWSVKEQPDFEVIGEFVMLQDQTKKKVYPISSVQSLKYSSS